MTSHSLLIIMDSAKGLVKVGLSNLEELEMGKRFGLVAALLFLIVFSICAESFRFSIVWQYQVASEVSLSVVEYTEDTALSTKALAQTTALQNVARIKYSTNEGGTHTLKYYATPLMSNDDNNGYGYVIYFKYPASEPTSTATINVGPDKTLTYPTGQISESAKTDLAMGESGEDSTQYVAIQVQITNLDSMKQNTQYGSTITIERQSR